RGLSRATTTDHSTGNAPMPIDLTQTYECKFNKFIIGPNTDPNPWEVKYKYNNTYSGWEIVAVATGGAGELAGIEDGDVILVVGLAAVGSGTQLIGLMLTNADAAGDRFFIVRDVNTGNNYAANF